LQQLLQNQRVVARYSLDGLPHKVVAIECRSDTTTKPPQTVLLGLLDVLGEVESRSDGQGNDVRD
jgi:hypothetical protein